MPSTVGTSNVVSSARVMVDLWDKEAGYYLNGTYYGDKDLLAIGVDGQSSDGNKAYSADFLMEKKLPNFGVVSVESEYAKYDHFGGYAGDTSNGYYVLGSYLFPQVVGIGKFEPLVKYAHADYTFDTGATHNDTQKTVDVELNYIIKQFNARLSLYYLDVKYDHDVAGLDHKGRGARSAGPDVIFYEYETGETKHETQVCHHPDAAAGVRPGALRGGERGRHHQSRRAALAVGHDGHQRDHAQRHGPHAHRRAEQEGRPAGQETRGRRGRPGLQLAIVCREGVRAAREGQGGGGVWLLDVRVPQVRAAGVREGQRTALLSRAVRGRGVFEERHLYGRGAQPTGDSPRSTTS